MKIEQNLNFVIPLEIPDGTDIQMAQVIFKQPSKLMLDSISPALAEIFSTYGKGTSPDIIVKDYERIIKPAQCDESAVKAYIERLLLDADILLITKCELKKLREVTLDEESASDLAGLMLFISALSRYGARAAKKDALSGFITSQAGTDLLNSLTTQSRATSRQNKKKQTKAR